MEVLGSILGHISDFMYTYILIILLIGAGLYFTFRTKFVQFSMVPEALRVLGEKKRGQKEISSFQALMISTASRVGTGNIAGVAIAVASSTAIGGYGAIFWMWLLALIGAASAFIESTLAQMYKSKIHGEYVGGPAYYIQNALHNRKLGILFSILLILCFAYGFNALQSFNAGSSLSYYIPDYVTSNWRYLVGGVLAILTAISIFGGAQRIGKMVSMIVPIMAVGYMGLGFFVICKNITEVPHMFELIFEQAFNVKAIFGGFAGSCVMQGIKRGLYSNEAGMGSAPNASASADVSHPVKQGLVQMLSVFIDTLLICSTTAFMLLLSGVPIQENLTGMDFVQAAVLNQIGEFGPLFITVAIFLFAFSSLIGNYFYTEANFKFITKSKKALFIFRISCIIAVFGGALLDFTTIWTVADILMGLMAIVNLISILLLGNKALKALKDYRRQKKMGKEPVFRADEAGCGNPEIWSEEHAVKWESIEKECHKNKN